MDEPRWEKERVGDIQVSPRPLNCLVISPNFHRITGRLPTPQLLPVPPSDPPKYRRGEDVCGGDVRKVVLLSGPVNLT